MTASVADYQKRVKSLVDQVHALEEQLDTERVNRGAELRVLRAQLREGLTPELIALRKEVVRWRDRANAAEARLRSAANG